MTRLRLDFAVTLMTDWLSSRAAARFRILATLVVVLFSVSLAIMCWVWLDPIGIAQAGFDAKVFAGEAFNFVYTERTQTLNWPTWVLYMILPVFACTMTVHGLANLVEDLGWVERAERNLLVNAEEAVT